MAKRKKRFAGAANDPFNHRETARLDAGALRRSVKNARHALKYGECKAALEALGRANRFLGEFRHAAVHATGKVKGSGASKAVRALEAAFYRGCVRAHSSKP